MFKQRLFHEDILAHFEFDGSEVIEKGWDGGGAFHNKLDELVTGQKEQFQNNVSQHTIATTLNISPST